MIIGRNAYPNNWKKECYIVSKIQIKKDEEGNEIVEYDKPSKYLFNYQPVNSNAEIVEFGERANMMKKAVIPISYKNKFKEFDLAYLDGANPQNEINNGDNANYRLLPPRNGNAVIIIYFEKIAGK